MLVTRKKAGAHVSLHATMKATPMGGKSETNGKGSARRLHCVEVRDRADEWEQTPTVASSRWTRTVSAGPAPSQHAAPTRFLRLLNCRTTLALIAILTVLSFGGVVWAQTRTQAADAAPNATNIFVGRNGTTYINKTLTRLDEIPVTTNRVECIIPCHADPTNYTKMLEALGVLNAGSPMIPGSFEAPNDIVISGTGIKLRQIAAAIFATDEVGVDASNTVRVFKLKHADAGEIAAMLLNLFRPDRSKITPPERWSGTSLTGNVAKMLPEMSRVYVVADEQMQTVVITAPPVLMPQIADLVSALDDDHPIGGAHVIRLDGGNQTNSGNGNRIGF